MSARASRGSTRAKDDGQAAKDAALLKRAAEDHAKTEAFLAAANAALNRGLCRDYVAARRPA